MSPTIINLSSDGVKLIKDLRTVLDNYGFTPTVIIIKDGKQVAGFVGSKSLSEFNSWYEKYGD